MSDNPFDAVQKLSIPEAIDQVRVYRQSKRTALPPRIMSAMDVVVAELERRFNEESSGARFSMTYSGGFGEGSTPPPEAFKAPKPFGTVLTEAAEKIEAFKGSELSFSFPHTGGVFTRLARASVEDFGNLDLIDLLTLRAHLSEVSFLVANAIAKHEQQR